MSNEKLDLLAALDGLPNTMRTMRQLKGLSLREVARQMDEDFSTLSRFERGESVQVPFVRKVLVWLTKDEVVCEGAGSPSFNWQEEHDHFNTTVKSDTTVNAEVLKGSSND